MNAASRPVSTGKTRTCPHCKATILESLSICPGCLHHLRFDSEAAKRQVAAAPALRVEGMIRHPPLEAPLEYFVIIAIRNDRGEEVTRQVVNVGALQAAEKRTFTLSVEVLPPSAPANAKSTSTTGSYKTLAPATATVRPQTNAPGTESKSQPAATVPPSPTAKAPGTPSTASSPKAAPPGASTSGASIPAGGIPGASIPAGGTPPAGNAAPQTGYPGGLKPPTPGGGKRH